MSQVAETAAAPAATPAATPATTTAPASTSGDQGQPTTVPKGAPETYAEFKVPEGMVAQPDLIASFSAVAKAEGFTQEQAQKLVTFQMEAMKGEVAKYDAHLAREAAEFPKLVAADKELGGANTVAEVAAAQAGFQRFGDEVLKKHLDGKEMPSDLRLSLMRAFRRAGLAIKEDSPTGTGGTQGGAEPRAADVMFPTKTPAA